MHDLQEMSAAQAAAALRDGAFTSEALCSALLERARMLSDLNIFTTLDRGAVLAAARNADAVKRQGRPLGPLHGVPLAFKDNIDAPPYPTTNGTPALRNHPPRRNAAVVQRLVDAGAIVLGKVGMHELAFGITSNNASFGAVRNPRDPSRSAGGSSGGSGAAVAAELAPASIGTDTGGSIRVPASFCGIWGFRPTAGRWPREGIAPISSTRDTPGPLTRTAEDLSLLDAVVTGQLPASKVAKPRIAVPRKSLWSDVHPETRRVCEAALGRLAEAGAEPVELELPTDVLEYAPRFGFVVALYEFCRELPRYLARDDGAPRFDEILDKVSSPDVRDIVNSLRAPGAPPTENAYFEAIFVERPRLQASLDAFFDENRIDLISFPMTPMPAPKIGEDRTTSLNGREVPIFETVIRNANVGSTAGLPGLSAPVGLTTEGLPVGLGFDAPINRDRELLRFANDFSSVLVRSN